MSSGQPLMRVVTEELILEVEVKVLVAEMAPDSRVHRGAFVNYLIARGLRKKQAKYIFKILDKDKQKYISASAFTSFILDVIRDNDKLLRMIFNSCNKKSEKDPDKDYLTPKEFRRFCYVLCGKRKGSRSRTRRKIARDPNKITFKEVLAMFCKENV